MDVLKHTPGPWEVHEGNDYIVILRPDDTTTDTGIHIDNLADARLAAAAPELLEACKQWLAQVTGGSMYSEYLQVDEADCVANTRAAIAKVEGKIT
jgi:hypothetical protein